MFRKLREMYRSRNIFTRLITLILIVIIIPVLLGFYLSITNMNGLVKKQILKDSDNSIQFIKHDMEELLTRTASTILYISEEDMVKELFLFKVDSGDSQDRMKYLTGIRYLEKVIPNITYGRLPFRARITLFTPEDILYTTYIGQGGTIEESYQYEDYIDAFGLNSKGIVNEYISWRIEDVISSSGKSQKQIVALKAVNHENITNGIIKISITDDVISEMLSKGNNGYQRYLFDSSKQIITSSINALKLPNIDMNKITPQEDGYFISKYGNIQSDIVTYKSIYNSKWVLAEVRPYSEILSVYSGAATVQIIILFATIILFIIFSAYTVKTITSPIKRLSNAMLHQDKLEYEIKDKDSRSNEINVLETSYSTMLHNLKQLMDKNIEIEKKKRNAELKALQAQISPHFLFNTLSVIRFSILNQKSEKAEKMIMALTRLLNATIFRNEDLIELKEEIDITADYIEIIKLRQGIDLSVVISIDPLLQGYKVPRLILQPIVENSLIHGLEPNKAGCISLLAYREVDSMYISVSDNGKGFDMEKKMEYENTKQMKFSGIGIQNIDERIKIQYGGEYGVLVNSNVNIGTVVNIRLPY